MSKYSVLLTGASGLIGRHVAKRIAELDGARLVCILREGERHPQAPALIRGGALVVQGNFYEPAVIERVFEEHKIQQIIHLAAIRGGGNAAAADFQEVNVKGTERLLHAACERKAQKFVFCSSVGVYGTIPANMPAGLESPFCGDNQYHRSKIEGEEAVQTYIRKGLNAYIVRPTITYGAGDDGFPHALVHLVRKRLLWLPRSNHRVHLVDVERLAEAFCNLLLNDYPSQRVFVVGDIEPTTLRDLADWIHLHFYRRPYPTYFRLPDWVFSLAFRVFQGMRNEKWMARVALLSNDWYYQSADSYRLLGIRPVPTREGFDRFLTELQLPRGEAL